MSTPAEIRDAQQTSLRRLLQALCPGNAFYAPKLRAAGIRPETVTLDGFQAFPLTERSDWVQDQIEHPPFGTNLTYPVDQYIRFCRTSGSTGRPMTWLDTRDSWDGLLESWGRVFRAAGVVRPTRILFAFSFGPFLGFWTAYEAATKLDHLCIPGGGLSSEARLRLLVDTQAEVICCTPTYALRLAQVASQLGIRPADTAVRAIIVAGEPGGSIPTVRTQIEAAWPGATVYDHHGMTEVGPVTYQCPQEPGVLHIMEDAYYAEVIDDELILTTLQRLGSPLLRYRTNDIVQVERREPCACGSSELALVGGIRGRRDDMVVIRGVNVFPSVVDEVVRAVPSVDEYQVHIRNRNNLPELELLIESSVGQEACDELRHRLQATLFLRVPVELAEPGSLPRFELKAKRWIRHD